MSTIDLPQEVWDHALATLLWHGLLTVPPA
jgi:hypothetical protein